MHQINQEFKKNDMASGLKPLLWKWYRFFSTSSKEDVKEPSDFCFCSLFQPWTKAFHFFLYIGVVIFLCLFISMRFSNCFGNEHFVNYSRQVLFVCNYFMEGSFQCIRCTFTCCTCLHYGSTGICYWKETKVRWSKPQISSYF